MDAYGAWSGSRNERPIVLRVWLREDVCERYFLQTGRSVGGTYRVRVDAPALGAADRAVLLSIRDAGCQGRGRGSSVLDECAEDGLTPRLALVANGLDPTTFKMPSGEVRTHLPGPALYGSAYYVDFVPDTIGAVVQMIREYPARLRASRQAALTRYLDLLRPWLKGASMERRGRVEIIMDMDEAEQAEWAELDGWAELLALRAAALTRSG
jgi:hypothetical protein